MSGVACVDLFCGAGGLTHGLRSGGVEVVAGIDDDEACRYPFETNNTARFIKKDVTYLSSEHIRALFGNAEVRVLAGCAPCQPFSTYAQRYDQGVHGEQWGLLSHFGRLVEETLPDLVTMENVPSITRHAVFDDFVETLERLRYHIHRDVVDCSAYGLPQSRRRMVLLASRLGPIELIAPMKGRRRTVRETIGELSPIGQGDVHPEDTLHAASRLSGLNLQRIRASRPGGTWRDWPENLVADCHRRETGRTYPGVYGRMSWDEPAPTLTTQFYGFGNGRFGHPEQDRAISLREGATLQGFPESYSFIPEGDRVHFKVLGRMIGNAVPVTLGKVIGCSMAAHLGISAAGAENEKSGGVIHCRA